MQKDTAMLSKTYPYYLANKPVAANTDLVVLDKYSDKPATRVAYADAVTVRKAIVAAYKAREAMAALPPDARRDVLEHCVRRFQERHEELALALCIEAGKPIKDARGEVTRLIDTFRIAAERRTRHLAVQRHVTAVDAIGQVIEHAIVWKHHQFVPHFLRQTL